MLVQHPGQQVWIADRRPAEYWKSPKRAAELRAEASHWTGVLHYLGWTV